MSLFKDKGEIFVGEIYFIFGILMKSFDVMRYAYATIDTALNTCYFL